VWDFKKHLDLEDQSIEIGDLKEGVTISYSSRVDKFFINNISLSCFDLEGPLNQSCLILTFKDLEVLIQTLQEAKETRTKTKS